MSEINNKQRNSVEFIFASLISIALSFVSICRANRMQELSEWELLTDIVRQNISGDLHFIDHGRDFSIFIFPLSLNCYMLTRNSTSPRIVLWWISTRLITKWNEKQTEENIVLMLMKNREPRGRGKGALFAMRLEIREFVLNDCKYPLGSFYYFYVFLHIKFSKHTQRAKQISPNWK